MFSRATKDPLTGDLDTLATLHHVMRFVPYNRRTLCAMRCVSKPYRYAVQHPKSPWADREEIMISSDCHCIIFNAKDDEEGRSNFCLSSVSPIARKFKMLGATLLSRYHQRVADGLTRLVLHHSMIDVGFFDILAPLTNLRELELVACRAITSIAEASRLANLESLEVHLCPLHPDGAVGLLLPKLKRLKLHSCFKLSSLNGIAEQTAAALEELYVENCNVYDDTANEFFAHFTPKLRILHLPGTHIDTALTFIPEEVREKGLTSLHLRDTPLRFETFCELAPSLHEHLEFLSLEGCNDLESYEPLARLEQLRFLDVSSSYHGEGLHFAAACAKLELFRMAEVQFDNIMFLSSLQSLRVLDAPGSGLNDPSLMFLEHLPMLDTVILTGCILITNINVLAKCPRIRRIFCARTGVTNEGISQLTECAELEELDLKLTTVTDVNFLVSCPTLKCINVCSAVSGIEGLQALMGKKGLEVICDSFDTRGDFVDM
ncbi:Leucine-rich, ribonuclease inhibitor subtype [Trypanosoma grayi]|uniref:Leucine-rich, ribonuclease inhibitor subtype n=1 Tax=Trypanosoma grayi TaxID=71804 RepID=UPI0004F3FDED|nr:Leucine-rich, ribonuclease inhibitor subtype [Trypanosoma grayi]KEG10615.1 Leucine-rich, ribonuclease inhibitor subtype [Trypanosoma grayi]